MREAKDVLQEKQKMSAPAVSQQMRIEVAGTDKHVVCPTAPAHGGHQNSKHGDSSGVSRLAAAVHIQHHPSPAPVAAAPGSVFICLLYHTPGYATIHQSACAGLIAPRL